MALREADGLNGPRVTLDGTPLLGSRTGIGRYVERLTTELSDRDDLQLSASAFTIRSGHRPADLPASVSWIHRAMSARLLHAAWARVNVPPVEWLTGPTDLFHATNFVLPPTRRARGVVTVHDLAYLRYPDTVNSASARYRALVPRSLDRAEIVCAPSRAVAAEIAAEYGFDPERIVTTPLGVDDDWFTATPLTADQRDTLGLPERYLAAVGTLEPRKNLLALIAAYRLLRSQDAGAPPLALVGPAGWGPALDLSALPAGSVISTGYLATDVLRRLIAGSAGLVFPSVYEGFGIPPLEALACGRPVIASDLEVTREVLGDAATLTPVGDVDALAQAIAHLLAIDPHSDAERAAALRRRQHARRWTWHACAEATVAAYHLALSTAR